MTHRNHMRAPAFLGQIVLGSLGCHLTISSTSATRLDSIDSGRQSGNQRQLTTISVQETTISVQIERGIRFFGFDFAVRRAEVEAKRDPICAGRMIKQVLGKRRRPTGHVASHFHSSPQASWARALVLDSTLPHMMLGTRPVCPVHDEESGYLKLPAPPCASERAVWSGKGSGWGGEGD